MIIVHSFNNRKIGDKILVHSVRPLEYNQTAMGVVTRTNLTSQDYLNQFTEEELNSVRQDNLNEGNFIEVIVD